MIRSARTVQRCDVVCQLLREQGAMTAFEIAQLMTPDLLSLPDIDLRNGKDWTPAMLGVEGRRVVCRLLSLLAEDQRVGWERDGRVVRWFVFAEDEVGLDQRLVEEIETIPLRAPRLG